jgi:probable rRNA maturation factor
VVAAAPEATDRVSGAVLRRLYRPPWRIDLSVKTGLPRPLSGARLADAVAAAASAAGAPAPGVIGLILTDDRELARLNRTAMGHRGPTDVLSFPLLPPGAYPAHPGRGRGGGPDDAAPSAFALPPGARRWLGEIVVSVPRAAAQAGEGRGGQDGRRRWSTADELRLLVTHGTLHVCGWDHADPLEAAAMRALERRLLGLAEPDDTRRTA